MNDNTISENQQIYDSGYLEQKNQEACQIDSANKRYFQRLHYVNLQAHSPDEYYNFLKDWREMQSLSWKKRKSRQRLYMRQIQKLHWTLTIKEPNFFIKIANSNMMVLTDFMK